MDDVAGQPKQWWQDAAERIVWTAIEAGIAVAITSATDLDPWVAIPIATGLAAVKTWVAKYIGPKKDAAITPVTGAS